MDSKNCYEVIAIDNERDQYFFYDDSSSLVAIPRESCIEVEPSLLDKSFQEP